MLQDIIIGLLFIAGGMSMIIGTYKKPEKIFWSLNLQGYLGGFCLIVVGIAFLFLKNH
jgi:uncharacterized membrane protein HdeD (DUF308 family)